MEAEIKEAFEKVNRDVDVVVARLNEVTARYTALEFIAERFIAKHFARLPPAEVLTFIDEVTKLVGTDSPEAPENEAAIVHRLRRILDRTAAIRAEEE